MLNNLRRSPVREIIEFELINPISKDRQKIEELIKSYPDSVAIHFRGLDKVINPLHYREMTDKYYSKPINLINTKVKTSKYFIFTDDPEYLLNRMSFYGYS